MCVSSSDVLVFAFSICDVWSSPRWFTICFMCKYLICLHCSPPCYNSSALFNRSHLFFPSPSFTLFLSSLHPLLPFLLCFFLPSLLLSVFICVASLVCYFFLCSVLSVLLFVNSFHLSPTSTTVPLFLSSISYFDRSAGFTPLFCLWCLHLFLRFHVIVLSFIPLSIVCVFLPSRNHK